MASFRRSAISHKRLGISVFIFQKKKYIERNKNKIGIGMINYSNILILFVFSYVSFRLHDRNSSSEYILLHSAREHLLNGFFILRHSSNIEINLWHILFIRTAIKYLKCGCFLKQKQQCFFRRRIHKIELYFSIIQLSVQSGRPLNAPTFLSTLECRVRMNLIMNGWSMSVWLWGSISCLPHTLHDLTTSPPQHTRQLVTIIIHPIILTHSFPF